MNNRDRFWKIKFVFQTVSVLSEFSINNMLLEQGAELAFS